ncbi:acyl-CoA dehydrogenase family protein [Kitasatospora viridis]|uniref:Alkylation response protein AidB-like acyl-CoA dehydrogenase n=1 Tax=Kitasatospora viridis TaxID=281105 RepID=A0A561SE69_9ACTN|nr:acyl-CoA dehydrogenase family protein [Kitasatospora viridis]TWF73162.1 alkylation response protein AidB-like acyl-CoA dehydrogenase [Kitasatospora viridis]
MPHSTSGPALFSRPDTPDATADWLARAEKLLPVIDSDRDPAEERRASGPAVFEKIAELGFHRMWVSRRLGGEQAPLTAGIKAISLISRHDASVSWQIGVQGAIGRIADYLTEEAAKTVFSSHDRLVVGSVHPTGTAERVAGGYRLDGRWGFASGSAGAAWIVSAARVTTGGEPTGAVRMLFVPVEQVTLLDTWHTTGLAATGSHDYQVSDVFVPEELTVDGADLWAPPAVTPWRGYGIGYYDFGPFTAAATALGIADGALDLLTELAAAKVPSEGKVTLKNSHTVHDRLARARAALHAAHCVVDDAAEQAQTHGETGGEPLSALVRLVCATTAEHTVAAVHTAYELAGATSTYRSHPLERSFRDIHTAVKHITLAPANFEMVGQYRLGGGLHARR